MTFYGVYKIYLIYLHSSKQYKTFNKLDQKCFSVCIMVIIHICFEKMWNCFHLIWRTPEVLKYNLNNRVYRLTNGIGTSLIFSVMCILHLIADIEYYLFIFSNKSAEVSYEIILLIYQSKTFVIFFHIFCNSVTVKLRFTVINNFSFNCIYKYG